MPSSLFHTATYAGTLAGLLLIAAPTATYAQTTITVTNCNDSGVGSLRKAVTIAASGDIIDLRALGCARIDLTSGAIAIAQNDLAVIGRGPGSVVIDAGLRSSVFRHSGNGTLAFKGVTISRGFHASNTQAFGGCIYSAGSVELKNARVRWCKVRSTDLARAFGGGIYATGSVTLDRSRVTGNTAIDAGAYRQPEGGGIYTPGRLTAVHSRICGNHAKISGGASAGDGLFLNHTTLSNNDGGALEAGGEAMILNSIISHNRGSLTVVLWGTPSPDDAVSIVNSTISGNTSGFQIVNMAAPGTRSIFNSTIAYNYLSGRCANPAVFVSGGATHIESTIAANNFCEGAPHQDIGGFPEDGDTLVGANNLIMSSNLPTPPDTIGADPLLAPLADNGGPTQTHALLSGSPAIGAGNNAAGLVYDQRGPGHPRANGKPDIGAFER